MPQQACLVSLHATTIKFAVLARRDNQACWTLRAGAIKFAAFAAALKSAVVASRHGFGVSSLLRLQAEAIKSGCLHAGTFSLGGRANWGNRPRVFARQKH